MSPEVLPVIIFVFILAIVFFVAQHNIKRQADLYGQQALKRGGTVQKGSFISYPRLRLPYHDYEIDVHMTPGSKNRPPNTYMKVHLENLRTYKIRLYREIRFLGIGTVFGQDMQIGDPAFDEAYVIQGSDPLIAKNFLQYNIQRGLLDIKEWNPAVEIHDGRFSLKIARALKRPEDCDVFIDLGQEMIKRISEMG